MSYRRKALTLIDAFRQDGIPGLINKIAQKRYERSDANAYRVFLDRNSVTEEKAAQYRDAIGALAAQPLISIILPVFDVEEEWLHKCIGSVTSQIYENWELCIADDRSSKPHIRKTLEKYAAQDQRIKVVFRDQNGHISAASNSALELATGEFCVLLDHDDELSPDALFWVTNEINDHPDVAMIYSDEDVIDDRGERSEPRIKPDFSLDLLYSLNLVTHLSAYRTDILRSIGGFRLGFEGSQDYDLALRTIEKIEAAQIRHIPRILYHWRAVPGSVAFSTDEKPYAFEQARKAIRSHFERTGVSATVEETHFNAHRVRYRISDADASVILYSNDGTELKTRKAKWEESTSFPTFEIVTQLLGRSTAESLNDAADTADGDVLIFADAQLSPDSTDWLNELVSIALQPNVGVVGGVVRNDTGRIVSGGIVLGGNGLAHVAHEGFGYAWPGNMCRNVLISNFSAVSAAFMAIRRSVFLDVGGFDALNLPNAFFDVDICLRIGNAGKRIVLDPFASSQIPRDQKLIAQALAMDSEREYFSTQWQTQISNDPLYNPNFSTKNGKFQLLA